MVERSERVARVNRLTLIVALAVPAMLALSGCSQLQSVVSDGARDITASAKAIASAELTRQICTPITDGTITADDQALVTTLLSAAESSGLADDLITSMKQITNVETEFTAADVTTFVDAYNTAL